MQRPTGIAHSDGPASRDRDPLTSPPPWSVTGHGRVAGTGGCVAIPNSDHGVGIIPTPLGQGLMGKVRFTTTAQRTRRKETNRVQSWLPSLRGCSKRQGAVQGFTTTAQRTRRKETNRSGRGCRGFVVVQTGRGQCRDSQPRRNGRDVRKQTGPVVAAVASSLFKPVVRCWPG